MVRLQDAVLQDPDGSMQAYLQSFRTGDRYLTATQAYLSCLRPPAAAEVPDEDMQAKQQVHAAVMQQLSTRTPVLLDGSQLLAMVRAARLLPSGCDSLDTLLTGGLRETTVTEIAGETCSGKTQLCHLAAMTTALQGEQVVYFDTTNAFSPARAQQLVDADTNDPQAVLAALSKITVVRCHSIHALLSSLDELAQQANSNAQPSTKPTMVVVDSVSAVLSPVIGASQHNQGHVLVAETARLLRHVAVSLRCCVLVTNHVVGTGSSFAAAAGREDGSSRASSSGINPNYKPALGEQWRGAANVRVQLSRVGGDLVVAALLTHPIKAPGSQVHFTLGQRIYSRA